jgi:ribosomal protein L37AE/L43A
MTMDRCPFCKSRVSRFSERKESVLMHGWKCGKCGESFFPGSEMLRFEILTGRRKDMARKIRTVGNSKIVTIPEKLIAEAKVHSNDIALFQKVKEGILLRIIHAH